MSTTQNDKVRSPLPLLLLLFLLLLLLLPPALPIVVTRGPRPSSRDARADAPGNLRGPPAGAGVGIAGSGDDDEDDGGGVPAAPKLTDCLLSAVSSEDCGSVVPGCVWCAEPIYGLCVTENAASKMRMMPFFKCAERLGERERMRSEEGGGIAADIRLVNE